MPRRRALTEAQLTNLLALPTAEPDLVRHWTLSDADLAAINQRRRDRNRIGFALQLCVLRYPGRLLRPGELIPAEALRFVAEQLGADPDALTTYAIRFQTRYEQLDTLREAFGFRMYAPGLRAGDIWVEGSRQWRAIEDQLIPPALFAAMRAAGPLPVAVPASAEEYLAERRALLERRMGEVNAKAAADTLEDVRISGGELTVTPLKAITPEAAEDAAERLYAMLPNVRVTSVLADVHRWTGFADAFTHLHTGLPADDPRVVLTAVLADATNLGLTRMADACAVASYHKLAWTAGWHLREDTYRQALATLVNAQQHQPLAALFGAADVSSSDGQAFLTAGRGEALGAHNARHGQKPSALFYTHVSRRGTRRITSSPFRRQARQPMSSTACSTMRRILASPSTTRTVAGSATTYLPWRISSASASFRASPISPTASFTPSVPPRPGRHWRCSSQESPTTS